MKRKDTYQTTFKLTHKEKPATVDTETGEIRIVKQRQNNVPKGKMIFEPDASFFKAYNKSWDYLQKQLTPLQFNVAFQLALMAKMNTNSLEPLNDETTAIELSEKFNIDRRTSKKLFQRLFELGVYARFEAAKPDMPYTKYWILNPYLSFSGKVLASDIATLFHGTMIHKNYVKVN